MSEESINATMRRRRRPSRPMRDRLATIPCQRRCLGTLRSCKGAERPPLISALVGPASAVHIAARTPGTLEAANGAARPSLAKDSSMTIRSFGALLAFLLTTAALAPAVAQESQ